MTNVERNLNTISTLQGSDQLFEYKNESMFEIIKIAYLEDISKSLASIADSLESLPPREENVRIGTNV